MKKYLVSSVVLIALLSVCGQNINPGEDEIYREGEIATIRLEMDSLDKVFLLDEENIWSNEYLHCSFRFTNSLMDTILVFDVGIRLRGNTSRNHPKKSFKLKFKEFEGEKFFDQKKFNLKAENNDPSFTREMLALQTFRRNNMAAARSHHTEVYINGEYMGLYLNVEQLDDEFVQSRFDNDSGNLYKCTWPATLEDDGQIYDDDIYELKTNKDINDRSVLAHFVHVLNNSPDEEFEGALEEVFNVEKYLKYLAVEALTGHWDGYSYNKNNFYLYENDDTGLIELMPYDVDNTFGIDWIGGDWGKHDVMNWSNPQEARPLTKRILARGKYLAEYVSLLETMLDGDFSAEYFNPLFDELKSMLSDHVARDAYFPLTFGYTFADFSNSYTQTVADHLPYGLKPFVTTRSLTAQEQLETITGITAASPLQIYPNPSDGNILTIQLTNSYDLTLVNVFSIQGKYVNFSIQSVNNSFQLNFENLEPGIYLLHVAGITKKFIVK
jgi:spore coat protein CotH